MDSAGLRALQAPLKTRYKEDPASALVTSSAEGRLVPGEIAVQVRAGSAWVRAGLHSATGGDRSSRCSADMLLEALVACTGVTLQSVATAMGIVIRAGQVQAEGNWDARGTLGVSRGAPVGITAVRVSAALDTDATPEQLRKLGELVERYCVVAHSLMAKVEVEVRREE
jgi:uncharacterized OsmC-like protein